MPRKMTVNQKRVLLAKDIIAQLRAESMRAAQGSLFGSNVFKALERADDYSSAKETLEKVKCSVCAKGAVAIGYIRRFNELTVGEVADNCDAVSFNLSQVEKIFPKSLLAEMEALFERAHFGWNDVYLPYGYFAKLRDAISTLPDNNNERLIWIMKQLIQNKGKKIVLNIKHPYEQP